MSDHWKSLADRLGAPSVDPSARRAREKTTPPPVSAVAPPAPAGNYPVDSTQESNEDLAEKSDSGESPLNEIHLPQSSLEDALNLSATDQKSGPESQVGNQHHEADAQAKLDPWGSPASDDSPKVSQQPTMAIGSMVSKPKSTNTPEPEKKKKRSNWERVANLFGLGSETESPTEQSEVTGQEELAGQSGLLTPSQDSNPVLEELFGHSTTEYTGAWDRPKRIVDDVGWDDDALHAKGHSEDKSFSSKPGASSKLSMDDLATPQLAEDASALDEAADETSPEDSDAPRRRSRRRRRRGKRVDGEGERLGPRADPEAAEIDLDDLESTRGDDTAGDSYRGRADVRKEESTDSDLAERRSSRRRRHRGSGRERDSSSISDSPGTEVGSNDLIDDQVEASPKAFAPDFAERKEGGDEDSLPARGRRRRRSRGGSKATDAQEPDRHSRQQSASAAPDEIDDSVEEDDADSESGAEQRLHRNIPTWEDTLSVLISANMENHRRNENRGSRGGRFKGRR